MAYTAAGEATDAENEKPTMDVPDGLEEALPQIIAKSISHSEQAFTQMQVEMTEYYKGELPGITKQDLDDGHTDFVSRDVHDAVMATMPDLIRIFLGPLNLVEFRPGGPNDDDVAAQATDAIRYLFEEHAPNDPFNLIHGALKDGLVRKFAVAMWYYEESDASYDEDYRLPEDVFAMFMQANDGKVEIVKSSRDTDEAGQAFVEATIKHTRDDRRYCVELVPPEEIIISSLARTARGDHLIGRRQNLRREELIGMGYSEALLQQAVSTPANTAAGSDFRIETSPLAVERSPDSIQDVPDEEDKILYVEAFLEWPVKDQMQLFKVCTLGSAHFLAACEPVDEVNMALWTPDPEPHTPVGESQAEKVADIQRLKIGAWRGIIDSLAESLIPRTEVVEGQVNLEDAMSTEIGGIVRVRQPNMVRPISQPFLGQQALPLLDSIDNLREERVGAFRAADGLTTEAMQSSTKMAVAATISGSKAQKELLARVFAHQFLRPIYKGLLKLFVQHQDPAMMMRLRGKWVPVDPKGWNADMDCIVVNVTQAVLSIEEQAMQLQAIVEKQEQILQMMGPTNPIVSLAQYSETLREMVALTGRRNVDKYFSAVDPNWQPPQQTPPPDPSSIVANAQAASLAAETSRKQRETDDKATFELLKHSDEMTFQRDQLNQNRALELARIQAQFGFDTSQVDAHIVSELAQHRATLDAQATEADKQRAHDAQQGDLNRAAQDLQHERTTQSKAAQAAQAAQQSTTTE